MPTLTIGTIDKRMNSTKETFTTAYTHDCKLKEPCSMQSPVFILQGLTKGTLYNYCSFEGRYYWVDDIVYKTRDIQEVHCHLDPLATYKDAIKATNAFCQLADKLHWNKFMDDARISPEMEDNANSHDYYQDMSSVFNQTGTIILRAFTTSWDWQYSFGGVLTWAINPTDFRQMLSNYYGQVSTKTIDELMGMFGGMGSLSDNILSLIWVPFSITSGTQAEVCIGPVKCGIQGKIISDNLVQTIYGNFTVDISYTQNRPYKKDGRWTSLQLITPFGYADIPVDRIMDGAGTIYIKMTVNKSTGDVLFSAWEHGYGSGTCFGTWSASCAIDILYLLGTGQGIPQQLGQGAITGAKLGLGAATLGVSLGTSSMAVNMAAQNVADAGSATFAGTARNGQLASAWDTYDKTKMQARVSNLNSGIDLASSLPSVKTVSAPSGGISGSALNALYMIRNTGSQDDFAQICMVLKVFDYADTANYENFCDEYGYPCNKYLKLGDITGYVKCSGASVNTAEASESSKSTINSFLNGSGVYIE